MNLEERIARFPLRTSGGLCYREAGRGQALVCLHGIGSSSAGWLYQLEALSERFRVIAWDAPGYEGSVPLAEEKPQASAYAEALHGLVERLLLKDFVLAGNSLGGLFAGAYARAHGERVRSLVLISPTSGFGAAEERVRAEKLAARFRMLDELGPEGMAEKRSPTLFGSRVTPEALALARWSQRRIHPAAYRQAAYAIDSGRHVEDARHFRKPALVVCGTLDTITPEAGCREVARAYPKGEYRALEGLGHVSHMEDPVLLNAILAERA
ncbi:MAG TPA: alpha/beta hydrolase [Burkholderiales bacterium]|nr:alpha/beta hydrolase [Burkholderiales bacterium]